MEEIKLDDHQRWQGKYKGIAFQVCKWKRDFSAPELKQYDKGYTWNFYIYIKPRKIKYARGWKEGTKRVDYYKMYPDVEMHGGITYWAREKSSSLDECDVLGCDYAHLWDYEYKGSDKLRENKVEWILKDIKETIDSLPKDLFFLPPQ